MKSVTKGNKGGIPDTSYSNKHGQLEAIIRNYFYDDGNIAGPFRIRLDLLDPSKSEITASSELLELILKQLTDDEKSLIQQSLRKHFYVDKDGNLRVPPGEFTTLPFTPILLNSFIKLCHKNFEPAESSEAVEELTFLKNFFEYGSSCLRSLTLNSIELAILFASGDKHFKEELLATLGRMENLAEYIEFFEEILAKVKLGMLVQNDLEDYLRKSLNIDAIGTIMQKAQLNAITYLQQGIKLEEQKFFSELYDNLLQLEPMLEKLNETHPITKELTMILHEMLFIAYVAAKMDPTLSEEQSRSYSEKAAVHGYLAKRADEADLYFKDASGIKVPKHTPPIISQNATIATIMSNCMRAMHAMSDTIKDLKNQLKVKDQQQKKPVTKQSKNLGKSWTHALYGKKSHNKDSKGHPKLEAKHHRTR